MGICFFALRSFTQNRSLKNSDREQIPLFALYQREIRLILMFLTVFHCFSHCMPESESLPSLFAQLLFFKERQSDSLFRSQTKSDSHEKPKSEFPTLSLIKKFVHKNISLDKQKTYQFLKFHNCVKAYLVYHFTFKDCIHIYPYHIFVLSYVYNGLQVYYSIMYESTMNEMS